MDKSIARESKTSALLSLVHQTTAPTKLEERKDDEFVLQVEQTEELADFIDMSSDDSDSCEEDFTIPEPVEKR